MRPRTIALAACLTWAALSPAPLHADDDWLGMLLPADLFGRVMNTADGWCTSTATVNSFQFLVTEHARVYKKHKLLQGPLDEADAASARQKLQKGYEYNGKKRPGIPDCTTTGAKGNVKEWWEAVNYWMEDFAPGTTRIEGVVAGTVNPTKWYQSGNVKRTMPTFDFLLEKLSMGSDVEIGYSDDPGLWETVGHAVTVTGIQWKNKGTTNLDRYDRGERAQITFVDPNDPYDKKDPKRTKTQVIELFETNGDRLYFTYGGKTRYINFIIAETPCSLPEKYRPRPKPKRGSLAEGGVDAFESAAEDFTCTPAVVPEPSSVALLTTGVAMLTGVTLHRRRAAKRG